MLGVKLPVSITEELHEFCAEVGIPVTDIGGLLILKAFNEVRERAGQAPLPIPEYLAGSVQETLQKAGERVQEPLPVERSEPLAS